MRIVEEILALGGSAAKSETPGTLTLAETEPVADDLRPAAGARDARDRWSFVGAEVLLGRVLLERGLIERARGHLDDAEARAQRIGAREMAPVARINGVDISEPEFERAVERIKGMLGRQGGLETQWMAYKYGFESIIDEYLKQHAAEKMGLAVTLIGMLQGIAMTVNITPAQRQAFDAGRNPGTSGAHAIGVADGGPGLPVLGWSTVGGVAFDPTG